MALSENLLHQKGAEMRLLKNVEIVPDESNKTDELRDSVLISHSY